MYGEKNTKRRISKLLAFSLPIEKRKWSSQWTVSNGQLHALLHFHLHPINHVVYMESHWDTLS